MRPTRAEIDALWNVDGLGNRALCPDTGEGGFPLRGAASGERRRAVGLGTWNWNLMNSIVSKL